MQKPISDIYRIWNQIRTQLGLHGVRIHDLRHSFASYIVANGNTLYVAQQLLGHSDPRTTMRYAHFAQDMLLEATATLDRILGVRKHLDVNRCAGRIVSKTPERRIRGRGKLKL